VAWVPLVSAFPPPLRLLSVLPVPLSFPRSRTPYSPCEQLLAAVVGELVVGGGCRCCSPWRRSPSPASPSPVVSRPPCEQWLAAVMGGLIHLPPHLSSVSPSPVVPALSHPVSTPRAVARNGGGGAGCRRRHAPLLPVVVVGSQQWEWVVGRLCRLYSAFSRARRVSVTWRVYRGSWVLTWWVSSSTGLPAPLCHLLAVIEGLASRLDREEGGSAMVIGRRLYRVGARRY
jgi:hypothetical protein